MNYRNSLFQFPLTSQFRGPHIFNLALTPEEEEAAAAAKAVEEAEAAEAAKKAEEERVAAEKEEDPLVATNPFEDGSPQHDAFEKQRQKFKEKLAKETDAARKGAEASIAGKLDEVLTALGSVKKDPAPAPETKKGAEATDVDVQIVTDALRRVGFDPAEIVQERRRQEVSAALTQLRATYPGVEFNDLDLVKYANDSGISRLGGTPYDVLELAFIRKHKDALQKSTVTPPPPPASKKKESVPIQSNSTKKDPAPSGDKPTTFGDWKKKILGKYS